MAQFDVVRLRQGELAVILQSDLLDGFSTRVVAPLIPCGEVEPASRLHPMIRLGRRDYLIAMEKITTIRATDLGAVLRSARSIEYEIKRAHDVVIAGV